MKICVLTKNYGKGYTGAMTATYELIKRWHNLGVDICVYTKNIVGKVNYDVNIIKFKNIFDLIKKLSSDETDNSVWYTDDHLGFLLHYFHKKYVHTYHSNYPKSMFGNGIILFFKGAVLTILYALTVKFSSTTVTVSDRVYYYVRKINKNAVVIRNGISNIPKSTKRKIEFKKPLKVIVVGVVNKSKVSRLYQVMKLRNNNFSVDLYGNVLDKNLGQNLKSVGVHLKGFQKDIPYDKYDLYLSLSGAENLSMALVEGITSGLPAVALNVGGSSEVITKETGFLFTKFNRDEISLFLNQEIFNKRINFDNSRIINDFNWDRSAAKYLKIFKKLW